MYLFRLLILDPLLTCWYIMRFHWDRDVRPIVDFSPDLDGTDNQVSINLWDISDYREKTIEYVSEIFRPLEEDTESGVIQDDIIEVGGFPAQKLAYFEGIPGKYEFQEDKSYIMEINILAYDRLYQIKEIYTK